MSRIFGSIAQVAYVVKDLRGSMDRWIDHGTGPWFYTEKSQFEELRYRGIDTPLEISCALANSGSVQIELIQQLNDAPSIFKDFIDAGHEGVQHIAYWTDDYQALYDRALAAGYRVAQEGQIEGPPPARFCYFDCEHVPGTVIELADTSGVLGQFFTMIREASENWDGSDPIRPMGL